MTSSGGKRTPAGLGPGGKALWRSFEDYQLDPGDAELLLEACRTKDTLDQLATNPTQTAVEARQQRLVLAKLVGQLRPIANEGGASVSDAARAAADARWKGTRRGA